MELFRRLIAALCLIALVEAGGGGLGLAIAGPADTPPPTFSQILEYQRGYFQQIQLIELTGTYRRTIDEEFAAIIRRTSTPSSQPTLDTGWLEFSLGFDNSFYYSDLQMIAPGGRIEHQRLTFNGTRYMWAIPDNRIIMLSSAPISRRYPLGGMDPLAVSFTWAFAPRSECSFPALLQPETWDVHHFTVLDSRQVEQDGHMLLEFTFHHALDESSIQTVRFDPSLAYFPVYIEHPVQAPEFAIVESVTEVSRTFIVEDHGNQIVLPQEVSVTLYRADRSPSQRSEVRINSDSSLRLNQPIDPERFTLPTNIPGYRLKDADTNSFLDNGMTAAGLEEWRQFHLTGGHPVTGEVRVLEQSGASGPQRLVLIGYICGGGLLLAAITIRIFRRQS